MDYEKLYKEALERAREFQHDNCWVTTIFPELKESDDERIRKSIISLIQNGGYMSPEDKEKAIAWLEKQGTLNKVSIWKHWKDGIAGNGAGKQMFLIKSNNTYNLSSCLSFECDYIELSELEKLMEKQGEQKPTIEMKSPEESLGIDSDTYNKIVDECIYGEQNPAWSEEDERNLKCMMKIIKEKAFADYDVDEDNNMLGIYGILESWLKSLKDRVHPQWKPSEEQIKDFGGALLIFKLQHYASSESLESLYEQLKKL